MNGSASKITLFLDYFVLPFSLMPERNIWLQVILFHFTIHIFFAICKALFHAIHIKSFPCLFFLMTEWTIYIWSFCSWGTVILMVLLDTDYGFPRMFLREFEVLFVVICVINFNDIFSFNLDSGSAWGFLARQVTDH